jgi:hypothetical protein
MPPLTAPRFIDDPTLQSCRDGGHRMLSPETGPAVRKVQEALIDLGFPLPTKGADSQFGTETGTAVVQFKTSRGIFPNDPVVGIKTMAALDTECFDKPPPPFSDRDEWLSWQNRAAAPTVGALNFTRADELTRRGVGTDYTFDSASSWLPDRLRTFLGASLSQLLEPTGSPSGPGTDAASWGAGPFDLYHCHLAFIRSPATPPFDGLLLHNHIQQLREKSATAPGAVPFNIQWATAHRANLLSSGVLNEAGNLANEAILAATPSSPLLLVWHTFERPRWRPATMTSVTPQRHWQTTIAPASAANVIPFPFFTPQQFASAVKELFEIQFLVSKSAVITAAPGSEHEVYSLAGLAFDDVAAVTS